MSGIWIVEEFFSWQQPITGETLTTTRTVSRCDTKAEAVQVASTLARPNIRFHEYDDAPDYRGWESHSEWLEYQP